MTNAYDINDTTRKTKQSSQKQDHQREDQPLKELNDDPGDKQTDPKKDGARKGT